MKRIYLLIFMLFTVILVSCTDSAGYAKGLIEIKAVSVRP